MLKQPSKLLVRVAGLTNIGLMIALLYWVYIPGVAGPELLDDRTSVLNITGLVERPELAADYIFSDRSGLLGRSVSILSFVVERMFLEGGTVTSKRINIAIHLVNFVLVGWLFFLLLRHFRVPGGGYLGIVLAAIWAFHPLHVSTVLYMVQRMTLLSCLFMLTAMLAYTAGRLQLISGGRPKVLSLVPVSIVLGLLSKENAIVVIPILLLLEVCWFRFEGIKGTRLAWLQPLTWGSIVLGAVTMLTILVLRYSWLADKFAFRPFSLEERLMTQARVVWDYVGQWFLPDVSKMGLYHDDWVISTSLTEPISTLIAVAGWCTVILSILLLMHGRWGSCLAFSLSWFLLGHAVESTVLPLELYFEHRNYFPTIGLAFLPGVLVGRLLISLPEPRHAILTLLGIVSVLLLALTSSQVQMWSSKPLLVLAHINGHPESPRANTDMAIQMAVLGDYERASEYSRVAHQHHPQERHGDLVMRNIALACVAGAPISQNMIESFGTKDAGRPLNAVISLQSLVALIQEGRCDQLNKVAFADQLGSVYLVEDFRKRGAANTFSTLAVFENFLGRYEKAYGYIDRYMQLKPGNVQGMLMKLQFTLQTHRYEEFESTLEQLQNLDAEGKLDVRQQQTLALYTEGAE